MMEYWKKECVKRRKSQVLKLEQQKLLRVQLQQHLKTKKDKKKKGGKLKRPFQRNKGSKNKIKKGVSAPHPQVRKQTSLSVSEVEHAYPRGASSGNKGPLWLVAKAQSEKRFADIDIIDDDPDINDPDIDDMHIINDDDHEVIQEMEQIDNNQGTFVSVMQDDADDDIMGNVNKSGYISLLNKDEDDIFDQNPSIQDKQPSHNNVNIDDSAFDVSRNSKLQQRKPKNLSLTINNYDK